MNPAVPAPLALAPAMPAGVSLAGLVSAAARVNVLGDVKPILRAAGLPVQRPGAISMRIGGAEAALA